MRLRTGIYSTFTWKGENKCLTFDEFLFYKQLIEIFFFFTKQKASLWSLVEVNSNRRGLGLFVFRQLSCQPLKSVRISSCLFPSITALLKHMPSIIIFLLDL